MLWFCFFLFFEVHIFHFIFNLTQQKPKNHKQCVPKATKTNLKLQLCVSACLWFFCSAVYLFLMEHIYVVFLLKSYLIRNSVKFQVRWIFFSLLIPSTPHCWVAPPLLTFLFSILYLLSSPVSSNLKQI